MKRELTSHKVNGLNDLLKVEVLDPPGQGGASHQYRIEFNKNGNLVGYGIVFHEGSPKEGANGVSIEALLAIVEDRLLGFQSGPHATRENAVALTKVQEAMMWLHKRTRDRIARGVEGTNQK